MYKQFSFYNVAVSQLLTRKIVRNLPIPFFFFPVQKLGTGGKLGTVHHNTATRFCIVYSPTYYIKPITTISSNLYTIGGL